MLVFPTDCTSALSGFVTVMVRHSCTTLIFSLMAIRGRREGGRRMQGLNVGSERGREG